MFARGNDWARGGSKGSEDREDSRYPARDPNEPGCGKRGEKVMTG